MLKGIFDVENTWKDILCDAIISPSFSILQEKLEIEYASKTIFPHKTDIFRALKLTDYNDVKVVIIGQDPYFNIDEADGLAFSCSKSKKLPPSLRNIFKELEADVKIVRNNGDLTEWAKGGVLLLNTILTVESGKPKSHQNIGWEEFTDCIIKKINEKRTPVAFILWGRDAIAKSQLITNSNHLIIKSAHPSPLSAYRGFFGSKPFSIVNNFLEQNNIEKIKW